MLIEQIPVKFMVLISILMLLLITSCSEEKGLQSLDKEVGFRFGMRGDITGIEDFVAVTTDEKIIEVAREQLMLPISERTYHISGLATHGNEGYNLDWEWHFVATEWELVEESVEVCDVSPLAIKSLLDLMPDTLTSMQFCPLNSYVKAEVQ